MTGNGRGARGRILLFGDRELSLKRVSCDWILLDQNAGRGRPDPVADAAWPEPGPRGGSVCL